LLSIFINLSGKKSDAVNAPVLYVYTVFTVLNKRYEKNYPVSIIVVE